jgi:hypothetical protein
MFCLRQNSTMSQTIGALAEERVHGFAGRDGIFRELIAKVGQGELEAIGELFRVGDRFR